MRFLKFEIILFFDKINLTSFLQININKRYVRVRPWSVLYQSYFNLPSFQNDFFCAKTAIYIFSINKFFYKNNSFFCRFVSSGFIDQKKYKFLAEKNSKIEILAFYVLNCIVLSDNFRSRLKNFDLQNSKFVYLY